MSSLQRYKKSGGFFQLLSLIETFGPQKKDKFIEMIESESGAWAHALREKMLTLERIFTWPDQVVVEVFKRLPPKSQAYALMGLKDEQKTKVIQFYSAAEQRRLDDVLTENKPKPEEIQTTLFKLVELARKMIQDREINPEKFDVGLIIPEDFENKLETVYAYAASPDRKVSVAPASAAHNGSASEPVMAASNEPQNNNSAEVFQLQRTLAAVVKENKSLKEEVRVLQGRLEQIRKIA